MSFDVERVSHELIAALRPLLPRIQRRDRALAVQLTRAASSVALNVSEANYSDPGNRRARFYTASGSANETRAALRVAMAWGYLTSADAQGALALLDRILAMLWKLSR
jgi:four helix bundle protein